MKKNSIIMQCPLFSGLSDEDITKALLILEADERAYKKGELLHISDTPMTKFGLVITGICEACADDISGNRMIMTEVIPGKTFGESLEFMRIEDSFVYIIAAEDASVIWMSSRNLFGIINDKFTLELQKRFVTMLASRTLAMNERIQVLSKVLLRDKLITYFSQLADASGSGVITLPMNREDLAVYMGTNRSALSRELSSMKKDGIIDYFRNTVKICEKTIHKGEQ